jgi:hypothetical protein
MLNTYDPEARRKSKMRSDDRIIELKPMPGVNPKNSIGNTDSRLFTGENQLHAVYNEMTGMWSLRYEQGAVPGALKERWTMFEDLLATVKRYFSSRNVEVTRVID